MTETEICNMSLGRIGANRINDFQTSSSVEAIACRLIFWPTVNYLLESIDWPFARARAHLSESIDIPSFEWEHQFILPSDFLCLRANYSESPSDYVNGRWELEGNKILTNDTEVDLKYTRKVTSVNEFSPLFIEVLKLQLAFNLIPMIAGISAPALTEVIYGELNQKINKARTRIMQESNSSGRSDWHYAHYGTRTR